MKIKCPSCAAVLNVPDSAAGKVVKCPCGKQLRAPGAPAQPSGSAPAPAPVPAPSPAPAQPRATPARPTPARPAAAGGGGADAGMFDELTEQDLGGVSAVPQPGQPQRPSAGPSTAGSNLMQQYAPTGGGYQPAANMQIASAGARLAGAIVDLLFQAGISALGVGLFIGLAAVGGEDPSPFLVLPGLGMMIIALMAPVIINAYLIAKDGQTVGKKAVGTRIVMEANGQLPGFVQGWLVRFFVMGILNQFVPFLGLIDILFVFSENAQTLHDRLAGTVVINA